LFVFNLRGYVLLAKYLSIFCIFFTSHLAALDWQMPLSQPSSNFQTQLAIEFAKQVQKNSRNRIKIAAYPGGKLYKGEQIFGAVKNDLVPIGVRLMSALDHEDLLLQLDALPFLAKNYREAFNLYKVSRLEVEKTLEVKGVKLLYAVPYPAQGLYSRSEIESLDDLIDKRFRPYSNATQALGEKLGMKAQIVPLNMLQKQFKKKRIDVLFGSSLAAEPLGLSKYFPYWYELQAWLPKSMMVVNLKVWNKLSEADQKALLAAARRVEGLGWGMSKKASERAKQRLINKGVAVSVFDAPLQRQFEVAGLSVVQLWLQNIGDKGRYIIERYLSVNKQAK
jgi:TRAP-type C4-dicarboxylate transport system substrate-binding protein